MIAAEPAFQRNDDRQSAEHQEARQRRGETGAGNAHPGEAEMAEDQAPIGQGVEGNGDDHDDQRPPRPLQRRHERAQDDIAVERQHRPLQPAHIDAGLLGQGGFLSHGRPGSPRCSTGAARSGCRPARRSTIPAARCGGCRAPNDACGRVRMPSSATSRSSGRVRRSAARNRGWRRARRRPACRHLTRPIIMTSVAVIAIWARLVRTIGQLSESVARISSRHGVSGACTLASIADIFGLSGREPAKTADLCSFFAANPWIPAALRQLLKQNARDDKIWCGAAGWASRTNSNSPRCSCIRRNCAIYLAADTGFNLGVEQQR